MNDLICFERVSKRFSYQADRPNSVLESFMLAFRRQKAHEEVFWAVRDVSFNVARGESVGLIGRNGSGKSTLLKLASRIIRPTSGRVQINGRVGALLELGAGFHDELTGRENVYLNASVLGLTDQEIASRFDQIVAFAELEPFLEMPIKHYSSGMYMRLGFSVAIHCEPEILFVDEVLAVGDAAFQRNAAVERLRQVLEPLRHIGCGGVDLGLEARHIQLGSRQQRAQLVVQFPRQMTPFFFAHLLQVVGQLGQRGRAVAHQPFQAVALTLQHLLLAQVDGLNRLRLAQVHVKGQQANGDEGQG